jgi:hypothetical protein
MGQFTKLTLEVSAEEASLLQLAFNMTRTQCETRMLLNEFQSFAERSQNSFDYAFAKGWVRKLEGTPRSVILNGRAEFRTFVRLLYGCALELKEAALVDSPSAAGLQNVRRELEIIKRMITQIAKQGDVQLPPLGRLSVTETGLPPSKT